MNDPKTSKAPSAKVVAAVSALVAALAVTFSETVGAGLGTAFVDLFRTDPPLVTSSAGEQVQECGTPLFVRDPRAQQLIAAPVPAGLDWSAFRREHDAAVAGSSVVEVSIQGETARTITLTGVDFDRKPPGILASTRDPNGVAGVTDSRPIRFPWTVSVSDPLLLYIIARTKRCDCTWRASVPWRSGGKTGTLTIDNDGRGYTVVGTDRAPYFLNGGNGAGSFSTASSVTSDRIGRCAGRHCVRGRALAFA